MDLKFLIKEPNKKSKSLIKKITHSGETDLDKDHLNELKKLCKAFDDEFLVRVYKECMKCLHKDHSQVRVSTVKLIDYLFRKSHVFREKLLKDIDVFLELTLAISQRPKVKIVLPPPKKHASLLQELTAKVLNAWNSDFGPGYEKLRYTHNYLREHKLVDFGQFRVTTREDLIRQQKLAERQERILTRVIERRLQELRELRPQIEDLLIQIESLLDLIVPEGNEFLDCEAQESNIDDDTINHQEHGIANLSQKVDIEFNPFLRIKRTKDNEELMKSLRELKKELIGSKLIKLTAIEKTLNKRSDEFVGAVRDIISLKNKAMNVVIKLDELEIVDDKSTDDHKRISTLDDDASDLDDDDFEEVKEKEDLETYIPKSMRYEYGLESIDPRELPDANKVTLTDESFDPNLTPSTSSHVDSPVLSCSVRLESGKLCPRRDKVKCPFHGKIIPRDHNGMALDYDIRMEEERRNGDKTGVPDWQDPKLLSDIKAATGIDLTMPVKGKRTKAKEEKLADTKTCDLTPKKRLEKRLKLLRK